MAKNIDTTQEQNDQAFRYRCNTAAQEREKEKVVASFEAMANAAKKAQQSLEKAVESAKKDRKRKLACEFAKCFAFAAGIAGLYLAETAALISPVLADPVCAIAFVCIGWHLCKIDRLRGRK